MIKSLLEGDLGQLDTHHSKRPSPYCISISRSNGLLEITSVLFQSGILIVIIIDKFNIEIIVIVIKIFSSNHNGNLLPWSCNYPMLETLSLLLLLMI